MSKKIDGLATVLGAETEITFGEFQGKLVIPTSDDFEDGDKIHVEVVKHKDSHKKVEDEKDIADVTEEKHEKSHKKEK